MELWIPLTLSVRPALLWVTSPATWGFVAQGSSVWVWYTGGDNLCSGCCKLCLLLLRVNLIMCTCMHVSCVVFCSVISPRIVCFMHVRNLVTLLLYYTGHYCHPMPIPLPSLLEVLQYHNHYQEEYTSNDNHHKQWQVR